MFRAESGMSLVEVMVAAVILVTASLAVLALVGTAARGSFRSEQSQVVSNRLQQEMEKIQQLPYSQIALTAVPTDSTDIQNPAWRVSGANYSITQDGGQLRPLAYDGGSLYSGGTVSGGTVDAAPTHFTSGDVGGTIHRFVVWEDDPSCPEVTCPGSQDLKRVIVAVTLDSGPVGGTARHYQELQTQISDPATSPLNDPNPGPACTGGADCQPDGTCTGTDCEGVGGSEATPWTFWLTDTPCDNSSRQPITADHLTHNTRGLCETGLRTGNDPGAPDLLVTNAPPLSSEAPLWDYATDIEPSQDPGQDRGLQVLRGSTSGCDPQALTVASDPEQDDPTRFQQLHEWLTPSMPAGTEVELDGTGTLNLWTQSVNAASYAGRVCVWLFVQGVDGGGNVTRNAAVSATGTPHFTYEQSTWPTGWSEIHVPLSFTLGTHLTPGTRLGLAVGVERDGTGSDGMQLLYDEPSFDSRLEVKTPSSVPALQS